MTADEAGDPDARAKFHQALKAETMVALNAGTPDLLEPHRPKNLGNEKNVTKVFAAERNDASYALARLRRDRPDIHKRVLAGETRRGCRR
jgi:hypothetical protein